MTTMMLSGTAFAVAALICGALLIRGRLATVSGMLLVAVGLGLLAATGSVALGAGLVGNLGAKLVVGLLLPLAVACYPRVPQGRFAYALLAAIGLAGVLQALWAPAAELLQLAIVVLLLLTIWWAYENGDKRVRGALAWSTTAWLTAGLLTALIVFAGGAYGGAGVDPGPVVPLLGLACLPAMVVGVARRDLVDVRGLVTWAVVNATVLVVFLALAVGALALIEEAGGRPLPLAVVVLACAVLAFGVRPLQVVLRGVVDEVLFGRRPDPLRAASGLVDSVVGSPQAGLDALRAAMLLPYAAIQISGQADLASGAEVTHTRSFALGEDARLVVGLRPGDLRLTPDDEAVLQIVTPLLAQTIRAGKLAERLRASVEREIAAVEEERRRIRRDLHDGIGPLLSGAAFTADAAANRLPQDPAEAAVLMLAARREVTTALGEIRRLVEGLRPPALDQLGLAGALRQRVESSFGPDGRPIEVSVVVEAGPLPAAVEVVAYRIVVEAVTNAIRHSGAAEIQVEVTEDADSVRLRVADDGISAGPWIPGTGLASMRERATLLGGTVEAGPTGQGGRVEVILPSRR